MAFLPWIAEIMTGYTSQEMVDMHFIYDAANKNVSEGQRVYLNRFLMRRTPDRSIGGYSKQDLSLWTRKIKE